MRLNQYLTIKICLICLVSMKAQTTENNSSSFGHQTEFKIGYFGNLLWDNGISIGAERIWKEKIKFKERRRGSKKISRQILFNGNLGYTTNFSNRTDNAIHTYFGLIWRRTNSKGKQIIIELSPIGYYRSFLPKTYEVIGDNVSKVSAPGRGYYAPSLAIGLGKFRKEKTRSGRYLNLRTSIQTPYNAGIMPFISLEYGYRFNF